MAETFEVHMLNKDGKERMVFKPDFLRVGPGDTVRFIPTDKGHNAQSIKGMIPEGAKPFKGKMNKEVEVTFSDEGVYAIECKPHYAMGMVMTVAVGDAKEAPKDFLERRIPKKAKQRFEKQLKNL
ncbi:pseudoazurin [Polycladidibacter stylochi]|uniref:pseudoazurin n=1 Tax=Polycladidibacter stylochi TaxID=1807766 RepID=UPI001FCAD066|nr:pseudoazurin [Pseudovibrio stylochi]